MYREYLRLVVSDVLVDCRDDLTYVLSADIGRELPLVKLALNLVHELALDLRWMTLDLLKYVLIP